MLFFVGNFNFPKSPGLRLFLHIGNFLTMEILFFFKLERLCHRRACVFTQILSSSYVRLGVDECLHGCLCEGLRGWLNGCLHG